MCRLETRPLSTVLVRLAGLPVIDVVYKAFAPSAEQINIPHFYHLTPFNFIP
jgi:hypothetical protein